MNITIYTKSACPNCVIAKDMLESSGLAYTSMSLDDPQILAMFCEQNPGVRQMPQIFIDGQRIGGVAGLQAALKQIKAAA